MCKIHSEFVFRRVLRTQPHLHLPRSGVIQSARQHRFRSRHPGCCSVVCWWVSDKERVKAQNRMRSSFKSWALMNKLVHNTKKWVLLLRMFFRPNFPSDHLSEKNLPLKGVLIFISWKSVLSSFLWTLTLSRNSKSLIKLWYYHTSHSAYTLWGSLRHSSFKITEHPFTLP